MRYRGAWSHGKASRNCCAVHAAVGCAVTAVCTTRAGGHESGPPTRTTVGTWLLAPRRNRPHDLVDVIGQKRAPRLRRRRSPRHVLCDRRLTDVDPELHELTVNAWRSPQRILLRHRPNQGAGIGGDGRLPVASATLPCPEQAEALAMPCDDGLRLHDHDGRSPIAACA